jgi:hypothetical protein
MLGIDTVKQAYHDLTFTRNAPVITPLPTVDELEAGTVFLAEDSSEVFPVPRWMRIEVPAKDGWARITVAYPASNGWSYSTNWTPCDYLTVLAVEVVR